MIRARAIPRSDQFQSAVARCIYTHRKRTELTQSRFCERHGLSRPYYCKVEQGRAEPKLGYMYRLAQAFGVSVRDLMPEEF